MESDLPLIEISGEDDSLLQQITALDDTTAATDCKSPYFSCSSLQVPISNRSADSPPVSLTEVLKDSLDLENPSCNNKENINTNKSEAPKLSMEPLQMKRRKKGRGYNLRKSLAWDRAFFTNEGVLDPFELSMISGTFGNSCGEALSVINEEGRNSFSGDSNCTTGSAELQAFEETLFKELPDHALDGDNDMGGCLLSKRDSSARNDVAPTSVATRKVLSIHASSRTESKDGGCLRPLPPSSLKRPANVNTARAAKKDSKLPKIHGPSSLPTTTKSTILSASHLKHNQIAQPVVSVQKNIGSKSSSKNVKGAQNKAKPGPSYLPLPAKVSGQHARRNLVNSPLEKHSSTNLRKPLVSKANSCVKVIPDMVVPSTKMCSSEDHDGSTVLAVSHPQNTHIISENMQNAKIQTRKPSGLRMPSPSLGFFSQPKAPGSHSLSQKTTQPCNFPESSICGLQKYGSRPPRVPGNNSKTVNDMTARANTGVLSSSTQCSAPSAVSSFSHKIMKLDSEVNMQKVKVNVPYDCNSSEPLSCKHEADDIVDANPIIQEHVEHNKIEKIVCKEDAELQVNDNQILLRSGSAEQLREDISTTAFCTGIKNYSRIDLGNPLLASQPSCAMHIIRVAGTKGTIEDQHEKHKFQNSSVINHVISKTHSADSTNHEEQNSLKMQDHCVSCIQDIDQPSRKQDELISCTWETDRVFLEDRHSLDRKDSISKLLEESQKYETGNKRDDEILFVGNCNSNPNTSTEDEQYLKVDDLSEQSGEHVALQSLCLSIEQNSRYNLNMQSDDEFWLAKRSFSEESLVEEVTESVQCSVLERNDVTRNNVGELHHELDNERCLAKDNDATTSVQRSENGTKQDHIMIKPPPDAVPFSDEWLAAIEAAGEVNDLSEQSGDHVALQSLCLPIEQNSRYNLNMRLDDEFSLAKHLFSEESLVEEVTESVQCSVLERNDVSRSESSCSSVFITRVPGQVRDVGVNIDKMADLPLLEAQLGIVEIDPSVENHEYFIDTHFKHDVKLMGEARSLEFDAFLSEESGLLDQSAQALSNGSKLQSMEVDGLKNDVEEAETNKSIDNARQNSQIIETSAGSLYGKSRVVEESHKYYLENVEDASPIVLSRTFTEMESSHSPSQFQNAEQEREGEGQAHEGACETNNMTNKYHVEDAQVQLSDGYVLAGSCIKHTSAVQDQLLNIVDCDERFGEQPELPNCCLVVEQVSVHNHQLHLKDYSFPRKNNDSEEYQQENILEGVTDVSEESYVHGSDTKGSNVIAQFPPALVGNGFDLDKMDDQPHVEGASSASVRIDSSAKNLDHINNRQFRHEMELIFPAISEKFDSALKMDKDQPKSIGSEEYQQECLLESVTDVPKLSDVHRSDSKGSNVIAQVPPAMIGGGFDLDKMDDQPHVEDASSGSARIDSSAKTLDDFHDRQFRHEMELICPAISGEFDSALKIDKDQVTGVITTCTEFCSLTEESGLLVIEDQTSSRRGSQVGTRVDGSKIFSHKTETKTPQDSIRPIGELHQELDDERFLAKYNDATVSVQRSENGTKQDHLMIKPPPDAVPFSDEWLAATEAAGEVDDLSEQSGDHVALQSLCLSIEQNSRYNLNVRLDDEFSLAKHSFSAESLVEEVTESVQCSVLERNDVSRSESSCSSVFITRVPGQVRDVGVNIDKMADLPLLEAQLGIVDIDPSVKNHEYFIDTHFKHDVKLMGEATSSEFDAFLSEESGLLDQSAQTLSNGSKVQSMEVHGLKNDVDVEEAETNNSIDDARQNSQIIEISAGSLYGKSRVVKESHKYYLENVEDASPVVLSHTVIEMESSHSPSQLKNAEQEREGEGQAHEGACETNNMTNKYHVEDAQVQLSDGYVLAGSCIKHTSAVQDQLLKIVDCDERFGEQPELPNCCLVVEQVSVDNHQLHLKDYAFPRKSNDSKEYQQENFLEGVTEVSEESYVHRSDSKGSNVIAQLPPALVGNGFDFDKMDDQPRVEGASSASVRIDSSAENLDHINNRQFRHEMELICPAISGKFYSALKMDKDQPKSTGFDENQEYLLDCVSDVPKLSDVHRSDSKGSNVIAQVPPARIGSGFNLDKMDDQAHVEDASSGSARIDSSAKNLDDFKDRQFKHEMELICPAISGEFDSALKIDKDQVTGVITTCTEFCSLTEESGLLVIEDQTTSRSSQVGIGVDGSKIFSHKTETKTPQDSISPIGELHHELENERCLAKDNDATASVQRSENGTKQDNLVIKPLPDAVPFSDEWLAAIEAAGEDILTMKSGAVQNSPPDKSLPEPGPWSPVKRKNNQIGPFDCTKKFTNTLPADSQ